MSSERGAKWESGVLRRGNACESIRLINTWHKRHDTWDKVDEAEYYSPIQSKRLYIWLETRNRCPIKKANWIVHVSHAWFVSITPLFMVHSPRCMTQVNLPCSSVFPWSWEADILILTLLVVAKTVLPLFSLQTLQNKITHVKIELNLVKLHVPNVLPLALSNLQWN